MPFTYDYPRPAVTVDLALVTADDAGRAQLLLIQRGHAPFAGAWALPGGFVDEHEDLEDAARRELLEETRVHAGALVQLGAYGAPGRDPRGHTVGVVYLSLCGPGAASPEAGDDAALCRWFPLHAPPTLAFDHDVIVRDAATTLTEAAQDRAGFRRRFGGAAAPAWLDEVRESCRRGR